MGQIKIVDESGTPVEEKHEEIKAPDTLNAPFTPELQIKAVASDWYLGGAGALGNKVMVRNLSSSNVVKWLYVLQSISTNLRRIMLF